MAIINWVSCFGKLFIYVYFVVGLSTFTNIIGIFTGFDPLNIMQTAADLLTALTGTFTWPIGGSLLWTCILNMFITFFTFLWYMPFADTWEPEMSAHQTALEAFFYVWILLGWGQAVLAAFEWILPFGKGW